MDIARTFGRRQGWHCWSRKSRPRRLVGSVSSETPSLNNLLQQQRICCMVPGIAPSRCREAHQTKESSGDARRLFHQQAKSDGAQVLCRGLARLWIGDNIERDLLSLVEVSHPGAFDRALMCTKTSWPPSSGWMKPKPFWMLNHFTVP